MSATIHDNVELLSTIERPREGLSVQVISEVCGDNVLNTQASFHGEIVICSDRRDEFLDKLSSLVDEYRK